MIGFYQDNNISPVRQDISNWTAHATRRAALYRQLGILPAFVEGRTVLEVGPGSGYNSLYTASLNPSRYVLIEGNPKGVSDIKTLLPYGVELVPTYLEDYQSQEQFDFVFCEGVLGALGIPQPETLFRQLMRFVAPGGVLVITCTDYVAWLPEMLRRLFAQMLVNPDDSLEAKVVKLLPIFTPHLDQLGGMSRRYDDWIIDNLINPASVGVLFTIPDAIEALPDDFEVYGASPAFITDWRWYKSIDGEYNQRALRQYWQNVHNFLDHSKVLPARQYEANKVLYRHCADIHEGIRQFEQSRDMEILKIIKLDLQRVMAEVESFSLTSANDLREALYLLSDLSIDTLTHSKRFGSLFGRGQQYLSFSRK